MNAIALPALKVSLPGHGTTLQDFGRRGWKRMGVSEGGAMDGDSLRLANQLVGNADGDPCIELTQCAVRFIALDDIFLGVTGASEFRGVGGWTTAEFRSGDEVVLQPAGKGGFWGYLAVEGGFSGARFLGSVSAHCRLPFTGGSLSVGRILLRASPGQSPRHGGQRKVVRAAERSFSRDQVISVWPGPQFDEFPMAQRARFFSSHYSVSSSSDRVGYRLDGPEIPGLPDRESSEPIAAGTIQVPPGGTPIVLMRDAPTMGGYPQLGIVDRADLSRLSQVAPPARVSFRLMP